MSFARKRINEVHGSLQSFEDMHLVAHHTLKIVAYVLVGFSYFIYSFNKKVKPDDVSHLLVTKLLCHKSRKTHHLI